MCICSRLEGMVWWVFDDVFVGLWTWSVVTAQQTRWVTDTTRCCVWHSTVFWQTQHSVVTDTTPRCCDRHNTVLWQTQHSVVTDTTPRCCDRHNTVLWQTQHGVVTDTTRCCVWHSTVLWHTCCVYSIINWVNRAWKHTSTFFWKRLYRFPAMVFQHSSMHCQCLKCGWAVMDGVLVLIFMAGWRTIFWVNAYSVQLIVRKICKIGATRCQIF